MTPRLSPERLAQISAIPDDDYYMRIHPKPWLGNELRDLLAELKAVTRERDEALAHLRESSDKDLQKFLCAGSEYLALEEERDKLKADLESWHKGGRYVALEQERDALRAENARLREALTTLSKGNRSPGVLAIARAALDQPCTQGDRKEGA